MKILLCGNDADLIDSFFALHERDIDFVTTSCNPDDIRLHIELFKPDAFVLCAREQTSGQLFKLDRAFEHITAAGVAAFVAGAGSEAEMIFSRLGPKKVRFTIDSDQEVRSMLRKVRESCSASGSLAEAAAEQQNSAVAVPEIDVPHEDLGNSSPPAEGDSGGQAAPDEASEAGAQDAGAGGGKKRILVVDDDPMMLKTAKLYLQDKYEVMVARAGISAIKFLEKKEVDLLLLDYQMPGMDGPQVLAEIRRNAYISKPPVIFLTGMVDKEKIVQVLKMNIQGYLIKPIERAKLLEAVAGAIAKKGEGGGKAAGSNDAGLQILKL